MIRNHRAASEIIGFVLVFSLILGTITIVYIGGLSGLDDARNAERVNNAERAFDVMANNFQQMGRGDAPNRATEIKLADAQLSTSGNRQVSIKSSGMSTAAAASPVTIRYDAPGDTRIVYENGAVIRVDDGAAIMRREPDFLFSDGKAVVRFIELRGSNQGVAAAHLLEVVRHHVEGAFGVVHPLGVPRLVEPGQTPDVDDRDGAEDEREHENEPDDLTCSAVVSDHAIRSSPPVRRRTRRTRRPYRRRLSWSCGRPSPS